MTTELVVVEPMMIVEVSGPIFELGFASKFSAF